MIHVVNISDWSDHEAKFIVENDLLIVCQMQPRYANINSIVLVSEPVLVISKIPRPLNLIKLIQWNF